MNQINFLPQSFYRRRHRRRRVFIESLLVIAVAAGLGLWFFLGDQSLHKLRAEAATTESQRTSVQNQIKEMATLQDEHRDLMNQLKIHRQVTLPVGFTQVLAALAQVTPESIAYTDIRLECSRPSPAPLPTADDGKKKGKARPVAKPAETIKIALTGLSPDDRRIADLVGKLADHPLFTQVKLDYSKTIEQDDVIARRFRMLLEVPLDRDYRSTHEGVAHAD